jgi:hypothetical protein
VGLFFVLKRRLLHRLVTNFVFILGYLLKLGSLKILVERVLDFGFPFVVAVFELVHGWQIQIGLFLDVFFSGTRRQINGGETN